MLENTIAYFTDPRADNTATGTLTKMSTDEQSGSRYRDLGILPSGVASRSLLIKHQGNQSSQKHLISLQTEVKKTDQPMVRCTVNITVTAHPTLTAAEIERELLSSLSALVLDSTRDVVVIFMFFLLHGLQGAY